MAIEQRADDAAIQNALKSFVFFLWFPLRNDFVVLRETANVQPIRIRRPAVTAENYASSAVIDRRYSD